LKRFLNYFELTDTVDGGGDGPPSSLQDSLDTIETPSSGHMLELLNLCAKINPFKPWTRSRLAKKFWICLKAPVVFFLSLTIPVVDEDQESG
jgi:hypothetical protein